MKNILVTGGTGFIGSHLVEDLLKKGNKVICVDDFTSSNESKLKLFKKNKNFRFIKHNIITPFNISKKVDEIYNLASPASPKDFEEIPMKILFTNSFGLTNVLKIAKKHNAKVLHTSTSEVYGDPKVFPQKETYYGYVNPTGPRSCYDEGKRFGESLLVNFGKKHKIPTRIARIFNTYGPRMRVDDGRAVPNFVHQCLNNQNITIYGNGNQTRSFCYVSDMVLGLNKLMNSSVNASPVNLGNPKEYYSILDLAKLIKKLTKSNSKIIHGDMPKDDPIKRKPDITLAKNKLKWEPKVNIGKGLTQTINWFKKNKNIKK